MLDAASNCRVAVIEQVGAIVHLAVTVSGTVRAGDAYPTSVVKKAHAAARENIRVRIVIGSYAPGPRRLAPRRVG